MGIRYPTFDRGTGQDQTPNPTALSELKSNRDGLEDLYIYSFKMRLLRMN